MQISSQFFGLDLFWRLWFCTEFSRWSTSWRGKWKVAF